jgi:hypothetical protein
MLVFSSMESLQNHNTRVLYMLYYNKSKYPVIPYPAVALSKCVCVFMY